MNTLTIRHSADASTDITINLDSPGALLPLLILEEMHAHLPTHDPIRALLDALIYGEGMIFLDTRDSEPSFGHNTMDMVQRNNKGVIEFFGSAPGDIGDDPAFKPALDAYRARRKIKDTLQDEAIQTLTRLTVDLRTAIEENEGRITESVQAEYESKALLPLYVLARCGRTNWADLKKLIIGDSYYV